jgi:hypothetical protein
MRVEELLASAPKGHGLRVDGLLVAPDGSDVWFDVTMYHPTAAGRRASQVAWHKGRVKAEKRAYDAGLEPPGADDRVPSPAMAKAVAEKHAKYAPIVHTAELQRLIRGGGVRRKGPTFWAPAMSHSGEMSSDMFQLIDWITAIRKQAARKGHTLYDGRAPSKVAAEFRKSLKDAVQVTVARTIGHMIAATGLYY